MTHVNSSMENAQGAGKPVVEAGSETRRIAQLERKLLGFGQTGTRSLIDGYDRKGYLYDVHAIMTAYDELEDVDIFDTGNPARILAVVARLARPQATVEAAEKLLERIASELPYYGRKRMHEVVRFPESATLGFASTGPEASFYVTVQVTVYLHDVPAYAHFGRLVAHETADGEPLHRLSDEQWQRIAPAFAGAEEKSKATLEDRQVLDAVLYALRKGCRLSELPPAFGSYKTIQHLCSYWLRSGAWPNIWKRVVASWDVRDREAWTSAFISGHLPPLIVDDRKHGYDFSSHTT